MACKVCGQVLSDIAQVSDFLQITVHALIAYDRQAEAFFSAYGMFLVFFEDGKRNRQRAIPGPAQPGVRIFRSL